MPLVEDVVPARTRARAATAVVGVVLAAFVASHAALTAAEFDRLAAAWGLVPGRPALRGWAAGWLLHRDWVHALAAAAPIWILGGAVEDRLGHGRFAAWLALSGTLAAALAVLASPARLVPLVGASGAAGAVIGAHLRLFPGGRLSLAWPVPGMARVSEVSTGVCAGMWLLLHLLVAARAAGGPPGRAVVWSAAAGLLVGAALAARCRRPERDHPAWWDTVAPPAPPG